VFADELIWGGDKKAEGVLKAYVTEERMPVERKGYDVEMRKNYGRLLVATNGRWAVPAGPGERRWFVLDVSSKFKGDYAFFAAVEKQMENGGLEAMMFDLQERRITSNQREAPKTTALADVASMGLESEQAWLLEALGTGRFYPLEGRLGSGIHVGAVDANDDGSPMIDSQRLYYRAQDLDHWPAYAENSYLHCSYTTWMHAQGRRDKPLDPAQLGKALRKWLPSIKDHRPRIKGTSNRPKLIQFPPLAACREEFVATTQLTFEWEEISSDDEEEQSGQGRAGWSG
jgi:hypothetical protein